MESEPGLVEEDDNFLREFKKGDLEKLRSYTSAIRALFNKALKIVLFGPFAAYVPAILGYSRESQLTLVLSEEELKQII